MTDPTDAEHAAVEEALVYESFTNDDGVALGLALLEAARSRRVSITVDVRRGEQQVFHAAMPGTTADNDAWVERKVRVVRHFEQSSYRVGCMLRSMGGTMKSSFMLDPMLYSAHGGAFPIRVKGAGLVGVVTVSGLPEREDHELVVEGLTALLRKP